MASLLILESIPAVQVPPALVPLVIVGTMVAERENVGDYLRDVGLPALVFCVCSLAVGFVVPRLLGIGRTQSIASSFEIGIHNSTLAIAVAVSVLGSVELAVPAAVYGVLMFPVAAVFGWAITRSSRSRAPERVAS